MRRGVRGKGGVMMRGRGTGRVVLSVIVHRSVSRVRD